MTIKTTGLKVTGNANAKVNFDLNGANINNNSSRSEGEGTINGMTKHHDDSREFDGLHFGLDVSETDYCFEIAELEFTVTAEDFTAFRAGGVSMKQLFDMVVELRDMQKNSTTQPSNSNEQFAREAKDAE